MASILESGSSGLGSSLGKGTALCFWARHFTLTVPLFTQVYEWVLANLLLRVALRWTSIQSRGKETGLNSGLIGHLARTCGLKFTYCT